MSGLEKIMIQNGVDAAQSRKNVIALAGAYVSASQAVPMFSSALDASVISGKPASEVLGEMVRAIAGGNSEMLESMGIYQNPRSELKRAIAEHDIDLQKGLMYLQNGLKIRRAQALESSSLSSVP